MLLGEGVRLKGCEGKEVHAVRIPTCGTERPDLDQDEKILRRILEAFSR